MVNLDDRLLSFFDYCVGTWCLKTYIIQCIQNLYYQLDYLSGDLFADILQQRCTYTLRETIS